jgi:hypothetical protein
MKMVIVSLVIAAGKEGADAKNLICRRLIIISLILTCCKEKIRYSENNLLYL